MLRVQITNQSKAKAVPRRELRALTRRVLLAAFATEVGAIEGEVSVLFVDDEAMRELNLQYRRLDRTTDVLSFPMDEDETDAAYRVLGDVVISLPAAERQAAERGRPPRDEVSVLLVHGALHLLSYDDREPNARRRMLRRQRKIIEALEHDDDR